MSALFGAMLAENLVLVELLGLDLFAGPSSGSLRRALRFGAVFAGVCALAGGVGWLLGLTGWPVGLEMVLHALAAVLLGFCAARLYARWSPADAAALGTYLPLAGANTAVLGLLRRAADVQGPYEALLLGLGSGLGFWLAAALLAGVRVRLRDAEPPAAFAGTPMLLLGAALLCLAFAGLAGLRA